MPGFCVVDNQRTSEHNVRYVTYQSVAPAIRQKLSHELLHLLISIGRVTGELGYGANKAVDVDRDVLRDVGR